MKYEKIEEMKKKLNEIAKSLAAEIIKCGLDDTPVYDLIEVVKIYDFIEDNSKIKAFNPRQDCYIERTPNRAAKSLEDALLDIKSNNKNMYDAIWRLYETGEL